jgi:hypothetical protein
MSDSPPVPASPTVSPASRGLRIWHFWLLALFVGAAIVNIQDQRVTDRRLIALAAAGFVVYGVLAWFGWRYAQRRFARLSPVALLGLYLSALALLFMVATVSYVTIEYYVVTSRR